ncbi:MAG: hypothetical protein AAFP76_00175 [Bacteroidota bacterium]
MKYTVKGRLQTAICDEHRISVKNTKVRLYALKEEIEATTAFTSAQSKEVTRVYEEKEIKSRKKYLLGETTTDVNGNYSLSFDGDQQEYNGGAVAAVLYYNDLPDYGQENTDLPRNFFAFEVLLDIFQPKWRETDEGLIASWNYTVLRRVWCYILQRLDVWVICGTLLNCESQEPLAGIEVIAMDDDIITDDTLGSAVTDSNGKFCIYYRSIDFKKTFLSPFINVETTPIFSFDNGPDIYFKFAFGGNEFAAESPSEAQKPSRKNVGNCLCVHLCLNDAPDDKDPPAAFYQIGYNRKYHPVLNIDPATGRTTGKSTVSWNEQAFFSTIDLRGSLSPQLNGQPVEYKFQYAIVADPTIDVGTIGSWTDIEASDIANTVIGSKITQFLPVILYNSYVIGGTTGPKPYGQEVEVDMINNWVRVPQAGGIFFNGSLLKLITNKLTDIANGTPDEVDMSGLVPGATSAPLQKNTYVALRMRKREVGNPGSEVAAGFSRPLAVFNTKYKDVPQGGTWDPTGVSTELGIATVDLQELVDGGQCASIANSITANYTAANPNLGAVSLAMFGPGGPHSFDPIAFTSPGEEAHGAASYQGNVALLPNCAYEVRLSAELNLTNGEQQHPNIWDRVLFCK